MAAVTAAAIGAAGTMYAANRASKGAKAQVGAADRGIEEQRRQYDTSRADMQPWMQAGQGALTQMQALMGGDFSGFTESPDYQFRLSEGMKGLDRSAAARGRLYSGGYGEDLTQFGQGLASTEYGNYWNRLAGMAGVGQATAGQIGQFGQQSANQIAGLGMQAGQARASGYQQQGQQWQNFGNQLGTLAGYYGAGSGGANKQQQKAAIRGKG